VGKGRCEAGRTQFDHSKSQAELGLSFRPLEETLRDEIAGYRDNGWLNNPLQSTLEV